MKLIDLDLDRGRLARQGRPRTVCACASGPRLVRGGPRRPAVFLDRDGTLIVDKPYNANPDEITLLPGVRSALNALTRAGYLLVVVTNQSGVARGYFEADAVAAMHDRLDELLGSSRRPILGYYFCPHHAAGCVPEYTAPCSYRKPEPGMLLRAAEDWAIDLGRSWMIGDMVSDVEAGRAAGCRSILLASRRRVHGGLHADNLGDAARIIRERDALVERGAAARPRVARRD
ncbi:MAG TPA: HAD family hydrolase [Chloroflexota bacterium]|nr:HAD family hydrolase [Chloroflexota bacterium]